MPPAAPPAAPPAGGAAGVGTPAGTAPARPGLTVGTTASGGSIVSNATHPAVVDSGPSADAIAVLSTIPEPLSAAERVPPPALAPLAVTTAVDSSGAAAPGDTVAGARPGAGAASRAPAETAGEIPVPAPTLPLGDRPGALAQAAAAESASLAGFPAAPPAAPTPAKSDSCWRVQVAAPVDPDDAELKRRAAESLLLLPMVIEREKGRFKVRSRDCLPRAAAESVKRRALASGLAGTFLFPGLAR
jgi:hypothetical protein